MQNIENFLERIFLIFMFIEVGDSKFVGVVIRIDKCLYEYEYKNCIYE